ncbi:SIMPL domain-containing protein [Aquitalea sp. ASV15]|uniref:SIMPL domain-containing protein n=1 Tax=Aquitalea sp. ASV15 TaxID=2795104 RepID=UPI0018EBC8D2|nr:SIMPL domain-containing protein [Aquitalea sp. ASV15]
MNNYLIPALIWASLSGVSAMASAADTIELRLSASAQQEVANDQLQATLYLQDRSEQPALLADRLNKGIARGLAAGKAYPQVELSSGSYNSWPSYDKGGKINGWQGRAEIRLKSRNMTQAAELVAQLQKTMLLEGVQFSVSDNARHAAEKAMIPAALAEMQQQADITAKTLGKSRVTIKELEFGNAAPAYRPPMLMRAAAAPMAKEMDVAQPDWQPGQSQLQLQITGKIELD